MFCVDTNLSFYPIHCEKHSPEQLHFMRGTADFAMKAIGLERLASPVVDQRQD
jgi:hypothetical protein